MSTESNKVRILDFPSIQAKLKRIAFEIYEANYGEKELVVAGIKPRGSYVALAILDYLKEISPLSLHYIGLEKEEDTGLGQGSSQMGGNVILPDPKIGGLTSGKTVVVVDDVLYSGRTLFNAIAQVMTHQPAKVQTAVLIDRGHRSISVFPDFVGLDLATTLKQNVFLEVSPDSGFSEVFLR